MFRFFTLAFAATAAMAITAVAQQPGVAPPRQAVQNSQTVANQPTDLNKAIAGCLLLGNQEEIALAQFAADRAKSDKVKEFAQKMIEEHQQAVTKLTPLAPELAAAAATISQQIATPGRNDQARANQPQPQGSQLTVDANVQPAGAQSPATGGAGQNQMFALQQRMAQECLALTTKELSEHEGADFDACYIGSQVGAHIGMLAKLRASEPFATGQLKQVIAEATQTVEKHLEHAKQLMREVNAEAAKSS